MCDETTNKTVGIIGLGQIGLLLAQKCKLLGMRVVATKGTPIESEWVDECYSPAGLEKLLKQSDFVVLALPLTRESYKMIGREQFRMMKKTAYLVNVARGDVVDEEALFEALRDKAIAGAALDAFSTEPLPPDSPLWNLDNVIISPHVAAESPLYMDRSIEVITENLVRYCRGERMLFEVDRILGY